jgi:uncharacterized membrane protein
MQFNPHPALASVPIVLLVIAFVFEIINLKLRKDTFAFLVRALLCCSVLFVIVAFFTGYLAYDLAKDGNFPIPEAQVEFHHNLGRLLMFSVVPLAILNFAYTQAQNSKKIWYLIYFICFCLCTGLAIYVGYLGGELVFRYGVGVKVS